VRLVDLAAQRTTRFELLIDLATSKALVGVKTDIGAGRSRPAFLSAASIP
jgi:hypothetical protein